MSMYSREAGPALRALLEAAADKGDERHGLTDEIDLSRALVERAVRHFERVCFGVKKSGEEWDAGTKVAATMNLRNALSHVADLVHVSAKVRTMDSSMLDAEQIKAFTNKLIEAIDLALPPEMAKQVADVIKEVPLPKRKGALSPEEQAAEVRSAMERMDSASGQVE